MRVYCFLTTLNIALNLFLAFVVINNQRKHAKEHDLANVTFSYASFSGELFRMIICRVCNKVVCFSDGIILTRHVKLTSTNWLLISCSHCRCSYPTSICCSWCECGVLCDILQMLSSGSLSFISLRTFVTDISYTLGHEEVGRSHSMR